MGWLTLVRAAGLGPGSDADRSVEVGIRHTGRRISQEVVKIKAFAAEHFPREMKGGKAAHC